MKHEILFSPDGKSALIKFADGSTSPSCTLKREIGFLLVDAVKDKIITEKSDHEYLTRTMMASNLPEDYSSPEALCNLLNERDLHGPLHFSMCTCGAHGMFVNSHGKILSDTECHSKIEAYQTLLKLRPHLTWWEYEEAEFQIAISPLYDLVGMQ